MGDLRVDIVDTVTGESLVDSTLSFQSADTNVEILFEPGAAFHTQGFRVKNEGDIPINFRLYVSKDDAVNMEEFNQAFEVWISSSVDGREGSQPITLFTGRLEAKNDQSDTYYLFVKMKDTASNSFQGRSYSGIGVTVYAVQGNVNVKE